MANLRNYNIKWIDEYLNKIKYEPVIKDEKEISESFTDNGVYINDDSNISINGNDSVITGTSTYNTNNNIWKGSGSSWYVGTSSSSLPYGSVTTNESKKEDIFMICYVNIDNLTRQRSEELLRNYNNILNFDDNKSFEVEVIILPVKNQPTKIDIINPKISNNSINDEMKKMVKLSKDKKYRDLINNIK